MNYRSKKRKVAAFIVAAPLITMAGCSSPTVNRDVPIGNAQVVQGSAGELVNVCNGSRAAFQAVWNPRYYLHISLRTLDAQGYHSLTTLAVPVGLHKGDLTSEVAYCRGFRLEGWTYEMPSPSTEHRVNFRLESRQSRSGNPAKAAFVSGQIISNEKGKAQEPFHFSYMLEGVKIYGVATLSPGPALVSENLERRYGRGKGGSGIVEATAFPMEHSGMTIQDLHAGKGGGFTSDIIRPDRGGLGALVR